MSNPVNQYQFHTFTLEVIEMDGEPWFIARPLAQFLGYQNPAEAIRDNCDEEDIATSYIPTKSNNYTVVNESGLYSLIIRSHKPDAKAFKRWVTSEVLPSIRKHGYYVNPNAPKKSKADLFDDLPNELPPFQRVKPSLLIKLGKMSKALAQAYLVECGVTPDYVQQQLGTLGDAAPMLGVSLDDSTERMVTRFVNDWRVLVIDAPLVCCTGSQALRLFYYWAENQGHEIRTGENKIMAALYRAPGFYHKRTRHSQNKQQAMLMVDGQKPPVNVGFNAWLTDCVEQMESALRRLGA
jgi:prophage antirepressor-like protein